MKVKLTVFVSLILIAIIGIIITPSEAQHSSTQEQISLLEQKKNKVGLRLNEHVQLAKLKGEKKLFIPFSYNTIFYSGFKDMDTAAAVYSVVIAQPVTMKTLLKDNERINTLYKFRTLEVLSEPAQSKFPYTFTGNPPAELQPLQEGEFLVSLSGGTTTLEGIEVTAKYDNFEPFSLSKKYLLFVEFDTTRRVGGMDMGPLSALAINDDGTLETLDKQKHKIKATIDEHFDNSLEKLKAYLKTRAKS